MAPSVVLLIVPKAGKRPEPGAGGVDEWRGAGHLDRRIDWSDLHFEILLLLSGASSAQTGQYTVALDQSQLGRTLRARAGKWRFIPSHWPRNKLPDDCQECSP